MKRRIKIIADRDIPYLHGVLEPFAEVRYLPGGEIGAPDADALIVRTRTRCDEALLKGSGVRIIATATIGYDHIDMDYCRSRGIEVATSAGCNSRGVLQWFGAVMRELVAGGRIAKGTTVGVVGVGNVGSLVARYARLWGFRVVCCDPPRERSGSAGGFDPDRYLSLEEVAACSDLVSFHVPLTDKEPDATLCMAGDGFFHMLKRSAVLLNSSRGEVCDQDALLHAVREGRCECVIDTWTGEPDIDRQLLGLSRLATPHIAGYTVQGKANGTAMAVRALARRFGWPLEEWYPTGAGKQTPRDISWDEMCLRMPSYFDITALSDKLKSAPGEFEKMRNNYAYREEFF